MKWWRTLFTSLFLIVIFALPAGAEKLDRTDPSYDFTRVKRVLIYDVTVDEKSELRDDLDLRLAQEEYLKTAARPKYEMLRPDKAETLSPGAPDLAADLYVTAEILYWHDDSYIKPEYTTWETRTATREKKHPDGSKTTETYTTEVPVFHPAQTIYTSTVRVRFKVCMIPRRETASWNGTSAGNATIPDTASRASSDGSAKPSSTTSAKS